MPAKITLRLACVEDAATLQAIYLPYVTHTAISFEYDPPTVDEFACRIGQTLQRYPYLVAECEGRIIGYAYAGPLKTRAAYAWAVELSIYLAKEERRHGAGRLLYRALEDILRLQGVMKCYACVTASASYDDPYLTRDSIKFHQAMGYNQVGEWKNCGYKFKRWYHVMWMEKRIIPHAPSPAPFRPFADLDAAEYADILEK